MDPSEAMSYIVAPFLAILMLVLMKYFPKPKYLQELVDKFFDKVFSLPKTKNIILAIILALLLVIFAIIYSILTR